MERPINVRDILCSFCCQHTESGCRLGYRYCQENDKAVDLLRYHLVLDAIEIKGIIDRWEGNATHALITAMNVIDSRIDEGRTK